MTDSRNLDNPLFDKWVEATAPYIKYSHARYGAGGDVLDTLSWEIGSSREGVVAVTKAISELPDLSLDEDGKASPDHEYMLVGIRARHELVTKYAWAIPSQEAIDKIVEHSPAGVVEIGAGTGYWARLLRERGLFVAAYDEAPHDNEQAKAKWSPVDVGGPEKAALWPSLTLFLCWPPYNTSMALECLLAYKGDKLVYVGEGHGMATGDDEFHHQLDAHWVELEDEYVSIPRWTGIRDGMFIYKRKEKS